MKCVFLVCIGLLAGVPSWGQKELKSIRKLLKSNNPTEAMKLVCGLEGDSDVVKHTPKLYDLAKEAQMKLNDTENEKIYLKQQCDTTAFFRTTLGIFEYALKCDSAEVAAGGRFDFRDGNREILRRYRPNLNAAGRWFFRKKQYEEARRFLKMYIDVTRMPIWSKGGSECGETCPNAAFLLTNSSFCLEDYAKVPEYKDLALLDSARREQVWMFLALSAKETGDTTAFRHYLECGLQEYPRQPFFFSYLSDYYNSREKYPEALALADTMQKIVPDDLYILAGKGLALMNLKRYEECIATSKELLAKDSTIADAYFHIGACYCNLANEVKVPTNINSRTYRESKEKVRKYYEDARWYMETYRLLVPLEQKKWAPLLYRIYLNLNLGKQFDEMDAILKTLNI